MNILEWLLLGAMAWGLIATMISYYRLRRENDRENGKGWRKKLRKRY
jgi:hypothetical protein